MDRVETDRISYYKLLIGRALMPSVVIFLGLIAVLIMAKVDHNNTFVPTIIILIALVKTSAFMLFTLKQLMAIIKHCHALDQLLVLFATLAGLIILSFALDFNCLYMADTSAFHISGSISGSGYFSGIYEFFYFSMVTFASVGYGDIAPLSNSARLLVMLEISLSFFVIVFALANIKNIHINQS